MKMLTLFFCIIFMAIANNVYAISVRQDVNQDGIINTTDAMLVLRNSLGLPMNFTNWQNIANVGDANCDNNSNSADSLLILKYSLGLDMQGTNWCITPTVSNVSISGTPIVGETLTLDYDFESQGNSEGNSIIVWSSEYGELQRGTSKTLTLTNKHGGNHIRAEVYPIDSEGNEGDAYVCANNNNLRIEYVPTYFIDSVNGNDSNDGLSEASPWKTLANVRQKISNNNIHPGDVIALKAGSKFFDNFLDGESLIGTSENPIVFTSYGIGEKPILTTIEGFTTTWTNEGSNIYSANRDGVYGMRLWIDGVEQKTTGDLPDGGCVEVGEVDNAEKGCRELGENAKFLRDDDNDKIYLYSLVNPSTLNLEGSNKYINTEMKNSAFVVLDGLNFEGGYQSITISDSNNIIIKNCDIGAKASIGIKLNNVDSIIIERNNIDADWTLDYKIEDYFPKLEHNVYYPEKYRGISYRGVEDGITSYKNISNSIIRYNNFKNWGHAGFEITSGESGNYEAYNNKIYNNIFTSPDIWYGRAFALTGKKSYNNEIFNNYIHNLPTRIQMAGHDNEVHHNLIENIHNSDVKDDELGQAIAIENYDGIAKNNIFYNNTFKDTDSPCVEVFDWYSASSEREISANQFNWNLFENCGRNSYNSSIRLYDRVNIMNNIFRNNLFLENTQSTIFYKGSTYTPSLFNSTFNEIATDGNDRIFGNLDSASSNEVDNYGASNFDFSSVGVDG